MMRNGCIALFLAALTISWSIPANAQTTSFKYQFTPYFWLSGLDGTIGARNHTAEVDASFSDILDHLDFGLMGAFDARVGRWRLFTDVLYIDVSDQPGRTRPPFIDASVGTRVFILDQKAGYPIYKREGTELDATGGIRFWHLKNSLQLSGIRESLDLKHSRGWVDPVVGLNFNSDLSKRFFVTAIADIGGFDLVARLDWQAFAGIGVKFNDHVVGTVGYRNLSVDYTHQGFVFDTDMRGLVLAVGLRF